MTTYTVKCAACGGDIDFLNGDPTRPVCAGCRRSGDGCECVPPTYDTPHEWISKSGRPWSLRVKSDLCAKCGTTPDAHPARFPQADALYSDGCATDTEHYQHKQRGVPRPTPRYDAEEDRQLFEAEVEDWYAAYDSLGAAEARTFEGRLTLYNAFQKAYYDAKNTRQP